MPDAGFNYIDLIILMVVLLYVLFAMHQGVWELLRRLASFIGALVLAFWLHRFVGSMFIDAFEIPASFANAGGFLLVFFLAQLVLGLLLGQLFALIPRQLHYAWWSKGLATIPAAINGLIFISLVILLLVVIPIAPQMNRDIHEARVGGFLLNGIASIEEYANRVFGGALQDILAFLTIQPQAGERIDLPYTPSVMSIDTEAEEQMLALVNEERERMGILPLEFDPDLVEVARAHSEDMWERSYFSHTNPDEEDPFDRMRGAGVQFVVAGENIALAPNTNRAHIGLMNSEGHRRNILDPAFGRVGIGVIDGGVYGKMFTQKFTN